MNPRQVFFLTMDAVQLTLALGIYVFIWPSTLLDQTQALASATYAQGDSPLMIERRSMPKALS